MSASDHRPVRTVLIPWVMALVALLGWNALAPDHSLASKSASWDGAGLSQVPDDAQSLGRISNPLEYLAPVSSDETALTGWSSLLLCEESHRDQTEAESREGAVLGRAPPELTFS